MVPGRLRFAVEAVRGVGSLGQRLRRAARAAVASGIALGLCLEFLPGVEVYGLTSLLRLVVTLALVGAVLRPVLTAAAVALGSVAVLVVGLLTQTVVVYVALRVEPGVAVAGILPALGVAWTTAVVAAAVGWVADAGSDEAFLSDVLRRAARSSRGGQHDRPGVVIVQIDGLSAPLLRWAATAGNLPNLSRWIRSGSHRSVEWHTGMPSTTPASQAGILHGASRCVPAFRWYEKDAGRLVVTGRPRDAADVERRFGAGKGLLAAGGVSIGNIFSGDAPHSLLTVSRAGLPAKRARGYAAFATSPHGLARGIVLTAGEMLKEIHQARRQRRDDVVPRVRRGGSYILLRGLTNVLLRDLVVTFAAEQMAAGAPVLFCTFVDYDEVAHHAGPTRRESLQTLEGVDRVIGTLERVARTVERRYELVVLSDHGQSQGQPFRQRYGQTLQDSVRALLAPGAAGRTDGAAAAPAEAPAAAGGWNPVNTLLAEVGGAAADAQAVVVASGNLAMVYLLALPGRASLADVNEAYPALVPGLVAHPGVGFVVAGHAEREAVVIGAGGRVFLDDGSVDGEDPLAGYGPHALEDLRRHQRADHVGDLVVVSRVDPETGEVAAFEELVGSHGGLGGDQTRAVLVHPADWPAPAEPLLGPDAVHHLLAGWLERVGRTPGSPGHTRGSAADAGGAAVTVRSGGRLCPMPRPDGAFQ